MKIAIISDIHGNFDALTAVFEDIKIQKPDDIFCLGDIVGYGPQPNECIELVKENCSIVIRGNHDAAAIDMSSSQNFNINAKIAIEWTNNELKEESKNYLSKLPYVEKKDDLTLVHSTPYEPQMWYYISSIEEAGLNFQYFNTKFCMVGHTHIPVIISIDNTNGLQVSQQKEINFLQYPEETRFLINVGSVGQPRDRDPRSAYAIFDTENKTYTLRRISYDIESCQEKMKKASLPQFLINRLSEGK